jgi:D-alanyl-D-alanine endopeptidase (penicillin-binding protein 7)
MKKMLKNKKIYRSGLYALLVATIFFVAPHFFSLLFEKEIPEESLSACVACDTSPFEALALRAESAYVYDTYLGKILFEKESAAQLPLASITKVMTVYVAREHLPSDAHIVIQEDDLLPEGDSGLLVGESFTRDALIDFTLSVSSNDGARAIARATAGGVDAFTHMMNDTAATLGMAETFFFNESGLDENLGVSGGYGSAHDLGTLFERVLTRYPDLLEATTYPESIIASSGVLHEAINTNIIAGDIPGLVAGKTGYTDLAGGNLAIVFEPEPMHQIIVVVLGSTPDERFADVGKLVSATIEILHSE